MQFGQLKRREFVGLLGGVTALPLAAEGQQLAMPVIGQLSIGTRSLADEASFRDGLREQGFIEGRMSGLKAGWRRPANTMACWRWQPNWSGFVLRCCMPPAALASHGPPRLPPRPFQSCSPTALIRSRLA